MAMTTAAAGRGRNRRLVYKVKSSRASDGSVVYSCIFSCIDDVEHHRHRRNPFDPKYIQAALSSFDELGRDDSKGVATREEVEAASTSVHVRMELIKSMKDGLVKLTSEAVKHCKGVAKKVTRNKSTLEEDKASVLKQAIREQEGGQPNDFFKNENFDMYQKKFGQAFEALQVNRKLPGFLGQIHDNSALKGSIDLGLAQVIKELDVFLNENTNFISEDELCFNISKETMETLHNVLQRTQLDIKPSIFSEDDFADLSPFKGFISPITKELILNSENSQNKQQSAGNVEENTPENNESRTKCAQKEYIESHCRVSNEVCTHGFQTTSIPLEHSPLPDLYQSASSIVKNEPLLAFKRDHTCDRMSSMCASTANSEPDDISSPNAYKQDSMEILSGDDVMEDIGQEESKDEIEDGDQMEVGTSEYFCLQNQDIEKFVLLRRQMKRSKNLWLAQNPEKLLLPDAYTLNHEPTSDDIESLVQSSITVGRIFREAFSRSGMDLVGHYKLLQEDPSKILGALCFDTLTAEWDLNDLSSLDICMQEPQNQDLENSVQWDKLDDIMSNCEDMNTSWREKDLPPTQERGNTISPQTSLLSSACKINSLVTGEAFWDNFSWSTGLLTATGQSIEPMQSPKCIKNVGTKDIVVNCVSSAHEVSPLLAVPEVCGHASTAGPHEACQSAEITIVLQPNCASSESMQSTGVIDHDMEAANQDDFSEKDGQETMHTAAVEDSIRSCLSSEMGVHEPSGVEGLMKDGQNQAFQIQKRSLHLDELIAGAVMAECQLHQKTFSHYDLEPLSRLLTTHMASIYQKHRTKVLVFKDLVDACSSAPEITLQRCFVALLSAAHQHNMGNLRDIRMEGLQILLEGGTAGTLSDLTISLSPRLSV